MKMPKYLISSYGYSPDVKNYKRRFSPVWHRMLYSCTHGNSGRQRVKPHRHDVRPVSSRLSVATVVSVHKLPTVAIDSSEVLRFIAVRPNTVGAVQYCCKMHGLNFPAATDDRVDRRQTGYPQQIISTKIAPFVFFISLIIVYCE